MSCNCCRARCHGIFILVLGLRRKADELRRNAKKETEESDKAEEMRTEANKLMKEASEIVEGPDLANFVVRFCPLF